MRPQSTKTLVKSRLQALTAPAWRRIWVITDAFVKKIGRHITAKRALLAGGGLVFVLVVGLAVSFYWPRTVMFSYSQPSCFASLTVLPNMVAKKQSPTFKATLSNDFTVAGYPLYSHTTCIVPLQPPVTKNAETVVLGTILKKNIKVTPGALPAIQNAAQLDKPVSTKNPLVFMLDHADNIFEYQLRVTP